MKNNLGATGDKMGNRPMVSVVMSFLNGAKFIREAVESVLAQTYDHWELWLVDDGSTDDSTRIALRYADEHPGRVFYLEHRDHENRGVCASRNMAIRHARGKYIALLDVDDVWLPHKLERQVAILQSQPQAAMVYGASQYWYSWTGNPEDIERDYVPDLGVQEDTLFEPPILLTLLHPLGYATAPPPSDLLMRRELIEQVGGFEEEFRGKYQLYEDQAFLTKVYTRAAVFVSSECWDRYRIDPDSCVSAVTAAGQYHSVRLFFLRWLEAYLKEQHVKDTRVWSALHGSLRPYGGSISKDRLPDLDTREIKWWLRIARGSIANLVFPPSDPELVRIAITKAQKKASFDVQLNQPHLKIESNHRYTVTFLARADSPRGIFLGFAQAHEPWDGLGLYSKIELTSEWQSFEKEFLATADDDNARIHFDVGESDIAVELSSVSLHSLPDGRPIEPSVGVLQHYPADRWKEGTRK
jgi:glycosyltransferase involved in cell wall biosynthesis